MQDGPFDRRLRHLRRDRAASVRGRVEDLRRLVADDLLERVDLVKRQFSDALDLGCSDGYLSERLRERAIAVTAADAGRIFSRDAKGVQCDEDRLPFADASFDLILSAGALDSVNDLPGALSLIRRCLRPDGLFLAAFVGAGSLPRLRSAMIAADLAMDGSASPRIHPQIDAQAAGDLLMRAGFALPVVDSHGLTLRFPDMLSLVNDLRALAGTNILRARSQRALTRSAFAAACASFAADAGPDGKTDEKAEIIYLTAWSPSPDQPRPARRGSAGHSLADALRPARKRE